MDNQSLCLSSGFSISASNLFLDKIAVIITLNTFQNSSISSNERSVAFLGWVNFNVFEETERMIKQIKYIQDKKYLYTGRDLIGLRNQKHSLTENSAQSKLFFECTSNIDIWCLIAPFSASPPPSTLWKRGSPK